MEEQGWWEIVEPPEGTSTAAQQTDAAKAKDKKSVGAPVPINVLNSGLRRLAVYI
jgi:hypothetical protein